MPLNGKAGRSARLPVFGDNLVVAVAQVGPVQFLQVGLFKLSLSHLFSVFVVRCVLVLCLERPIKVASCRRSTPRS